MGTTGSLETHYQVQQKISHSLGATGLNQYTLKGPDSGAFGEVRRCIDTRTKEARAVKHIPKTTSQRRVEVLHEIDMMKLVSGKHNTILQFMEYFEDSGHFDLVFEFCEKGSLEDALKRQEMSTPKTALFGHQLLTALSFLRNARILHRDVKPSNVLLKSDSHVKLGDFGTAVLHEADKPLWQPSGTPLFFPPEIQILPSGYGYSFPVDIWAAGLTLYMLFFSGQHPFLNSSRCIDQKLLRSASFSVGWMQVWDTKAAELLRWLLMPFPGQRITAANACEHPWFHSQGYGSGSFEQSPPTKMVADSQGRWQEDPWG
jgi:cell cycle serine/threonine-protein kinase CDC5/MSD2